MPRISGFILLTLLFWIPSTASAQLLAAKDGPIVYGHHHLNVSSVDEHRKFWVDTLGGSAARIGTDNREIIKFPNALIFLRAQKPTGGTKGSTVDHIALSFRDLRQVVDRVKAAGFRIVTTQEAPPNVEVRNDIGQVNAGGVTGIAYALGPDDVKIEMLEMKAQAAPVMSHHVHFSAQSSKEMQAWYVKTFGADSRPSPNPAFLSAALPGVGLNFSEAPAKAAGTQGRALDHIGFEVRNLEAFTKRLEAQGIALASPYRQVPALGISIAFLTDPWGTYIELTEGLAKVQ